MASVAHHIAINETIAATDHPIELKPEGAGIKFMHIKIMSPKIKPFFLYTFIII